MKFSTKLRLIIFAISLTASTSISYLVYSSNVKTLEEHIKDRLMNQAFHTMDKIDRMLFERFGDIKTLASDPVIMSRNATPKQITERLTAYKNNYKAYASLSFFDLNRIRIADTEGIGLGSQHSFSAYWHEISRGIDITYDISVSESLNKTVFHFAAVVKDEKGTPFGVVVSRMLAENLYDLVNQAVGIYDIEKDFKVDLVDRDGVILYSNQKNEATLKKVSVDWDSVKKPLMQGVKVGAIRQRNPMEAAEDEILVFVAEHGYQDYKGKDWTLLICAPTKVAFASAMELNRKLIILLLVIAFSALLVIYFLSERLTRNIEELSVASTKVAAGDLDLHVKVTSRDEIGSLSVAFNKMVDDLKNSRDKLQAYSGELETRVAERTAELLEANKLLKKSGATLAKAQQIAKLGNWEFDIAGGNVTWSDEMYRIYGLHPEQFKLTYEAFLSRVHPDDRGFVSKAVGSALNENKPYGSDYRIIIPDGTVRNLHTESELVFDDTGKPVRLRGITQDITERKKFQAELEKKAKLESIGILAGGMAHDFNNLLTGVLGNISLTKMHMRPDNKDFNRLSEAEDVCGQMTELTRRIITFSEGGSPFRKALLLSTIINETTCSELSGPAISCRCDFSEGLSPVYADDGQIRQVFRNMVLNAKEAMPEGGVIRVIAENIILDKDDGVLKEGKYVKITIKDSGKGIPEEILPKIFDPYFTTKQMGSDKGMGLGLAVCYSIIKKHDGHITVESKAGEGSTFHIYIPAVEEMYEI